MKTNSIPNIHRSIQGQISIMMGAMMSTFLLFFVFVIQVGMLVNARINLQNAADMAAYSGAAVLGRQLTHISFLNYEMRKQWKKFLFRIYVIGNMSQDSFPRALAGSAPMSYIPNTGSASVDNYGVPSTCVIWNPNDNFCHVTELAPISVPPMTYLDAINDTLRNQLLQVEQIREDNCLSIGKTNQMLNILWLYNSDPTLSQLQNSGGLTAQQSTILSLLKNLGSGIGIVPRELILNFRIKTLAQYVNLAPQLGLTLDQVNQYRQGIEPMRYERAIQAYLSAYYSLGNHLFPVNDVVLDELLPSSSSGAALLRLIPIEQAFDTYYIDLQTPANVNVNATGSDTNTTPCKAAVVPVPVSTPLTVGFAKDPKMLTYYAVRMSAKVHLLFSPFGDFKMKAYAAAQPFGSRIGPPVNDVGFATEKMPSTPRAQPGSVGFIPNLAVIGSDGGIPGSGTGWDNQKVVSTLYNILTQQSPASNGSGAGISDNDLIQGAQAAMGPNPWEGGKYNIMADVGNEYFIKNFGTDNIARMWAPIFLETELSNLSQTVQSELNNFFANSPQVASNIQGAIQQQLLNYLGSALPQGQGETGESTHVATFTNPISNPAVFGSEIFLTDPSVIRSSWCNIGDATLKAPGRIGYSVKFVPFVSLLSDKLTTDGTTTWSNPMSLDEEASKDIPLIQH